MTDEELSGYMHVPLAVLRKCMPLSIYYTRDKTAGFIMTPQGRRVSVWALRDDLLQIKEAMETYVAKEILLKD
jgi:hypothetical protein